MKNKKDLIHICNIKKSNNWENEELMISPSLTFYIIGGGGMSHEYCNKVTDKETKKIIFDNLGDDKLKL